MYRVNIEQFEGPLDLLLEIIEDKKLPLIEISLSRITDQFLEYLKNLKKKRPEEAVDFLVVASRLVLLKSRELIPPQQNQNEEDGLSDQESIEELQRQLALYQPFRRAAKQLKKIEREGTVFYAREGFANFKSIFYFPKGLTGKNLVQALQELLTSVTMPQRNPQARIKDIISLESCIKKLEGALSTQKKVDFSELASGWKKEVKMVHFLGVLELLRLGKIKIEQKKNFGTILIHT